MAKLYISEYAALGKGDVVSKEPALVEQTPVVIGASSLQSAAFGAGTNYVRIHTDNSCSIAFGSNPTATADSKRLANNQTEYFGVTPGDKVAVIINT